MNEFEDQLRRELRGEAVSPDEFFVARIDDAVARVQRRRALGLAMATLIMIALSVALTFGLASLEFLWTFPTKSLQAMLPTEVLASTAVPLSIVLGLIALLLAPLLQPKR